MDKLYDLMTMGSKYQVLAVRVRANLHPCIPRLLLSLHLLD